MENNDPQTESSIGLEQVKTRDDVFRKVREILTLILAVEDAEVIPKARLTNDLGAESIDYYDLMFLLEKKFGIQISRDQFFPKDIFSNPEFMQNGRITPKGINAIKKHLYFIDLSTFEIDPDLNKFAEIYTVETLVNFVWLKLPENKA